MAQPVSVGVGMTGNFYFLVWAAFHLWLAPWSWPQVASSKETWIILECVSPFIQSTEKARSLELGSNLACKWHLVMLTGRRKLPGSMKKIHSIALVSTHADREADLERINRCTTWRTVSPGGKRNLIESTWRLSERIHVPHWAGSLACLLINNGGLDYSHTCALCYLCCSFST